jgi:RNA-binding protein
MARPRPIQRARRPAAAPRRVARKTRAEAGPPAPAPDLTPAQARFLRGQAHDLKAMLQIGGKGLTDALVAEVSEALVHHELIKVKIAASDREARNALIAALAERCQAALVQRIGHVAVLYRPNAEKRQIVLPRA